ncbi:MAG: hypothetical protein JF886_15670 [Candidatus Dormibacteraeota bacterium]|uniref:Uncharacterized protein n=1 Tax=Candidatus Aeolococcus gillhamiae TaxID=3127015 RepID=A0A934K4M6_9BACT|nr:hypothetical protein [Candidatus Dormibacteraeota bacterium]
MTPLKPDPEIVTAAPIGPLVGFRTVIVGCTVKDRDEVPAPPELVTVIGPLVAPVGTVAVTWVSLFTVKTGWLMPLKATPVAEVNPLPVMLTVPPSGPAEGLKPVTVGGGDVAIANVAIVPVQPAGLLRVTPYPCGPSALTTFHAVCSPLAVPEAFDCSMVPMAYPAGALGVTFAFHPMAPTTISFAWVVADVVPVDADALFAESATVRSNAVAEVPVMSRTVIASAAGVVTVTVTPATPTACAAYQISPSAWVPWMTVTALTHTFLAESEMPFTVDSALVSRARMAATSRSPLPVLVAVDAVSEVAVEALAAPKLCATPHDVPNPGMACATVHPITVVATIPPSASERACRANQVPPAANRCGRASIKSPPPVPCAVIGTRHCRRFW